MKNIFVSSTFRDMQAERDMLQKEVLPQLKNKAKAYGENINLIDLRWGVDTSELESEEGSMKVMSVCLDEVERSKPYMLIFLGDRYGSIIDPAITEKVIARKNSDFKLEDYAISITAMEVEFGALAEQYGSLENCVVCMRRYAPEEIADASDRAAYSAENAQMAQKQKAFKDKVVNKLQGRVIEYTCDWDAQKKQLVDFKTLDGEALSDKLLRTYESMFQTEWESFGRLSWEEKEQLAVDSIVESKLKSFNGRQKLMEKYYQKAMEADTALILQGAVGSGKTSIMCKLAEMLEESGKQVFRFIAGYSSMSETAMQLVQQMVYYLEKLLGMEHLASQVDSCERAEEQNTKTLNYKDWTERLGKLAVQLKGKETVYFIIDAVDQMYQDEHVKRLDFVQAEECLKYVISCTDEFDIPKSYGSCELVVEQIPLLNIQDAQEVVEGLLTASHRNVYKDIRSEILGKKSANNPLYISMLIQRLNMMGFEELYSAWTESDIIRHSCQVIRDMPDGEEAAAVFIIDEAIKRLADTADTSEGLRNVINMIGVSRGGLREADILDITKAMGKPVSQLDLSRLMHYLDTFFVLHQDGRIDFTHKVIRKGIRASVDNQKYIEVIATRVKALDETDELWKSEGMYYARMTGDTRFVEQIISYVRVSLDKTVLATIKAEGLADGGAFYCDNLEHMPMTLNFLMLYGERLYDLVREEIALEEKIYRKCMEIWMALFAKIKTQQSLSALAQSCLNVGRVLEKQGKTEAALEYFKNALKAREMLYEESKKQESLRELASSYVSMGRSLEIQGNIPEALKYYEKALEADEKLYETTHTPENLRSCAMGYDNVGRMLSHQKQLEEALEYFIRSLEIRKKLREQVKTTESLRDLSVSYSNIARVYLHQGKADEALVYYYKALEGKERLHELSGTLHSLQELSFVYDNIGKAFELQRETGEALKYHEKALKMCEEVYRQSGTGQSLRELAVSYNNMGNVLRMQKRLTEALEYYKKNLEISIKLDEMGRTPFSLEELSIGYDSVGGTLVMLNRQEEALVYYKKCLEVNEELHERRKTLQSLTQLSLVYYNMGRMMEQLDKLAEAEGYYKSALAAKKTIYDSSQTLKHLKDLSMGYTHVGRMQEKQRKPADAYLHYRKSLEAREIIFDKLKDLQSISELSIGYNNVGRALEMQGRMEEALEYYKMFLGASEVIFNKNKTEQSLHNLAISCQCMINVLRSLGREKETEIFYEKVKKAKEALLAAQPK